MQPSRYSFKDDPQLLNIRLNIGMTGFGKSSLLRYQLARIVAANRKRQIDRIILVDPSQDDFHFGTFGHRLETAKEICDLLNSNSLLSYHLRCITRNLAVFDYLCWEIYRREDIFLLVDEVWNFCPTKAGARMEPPEFNRLAIESRHVRVRILGTCQRPSQIHNNLLNLAQEVNIFRTEDLSLVKQKLRTPANLERVAQLERLQFFSCKNGAPSLCSVPPQNG